MDKTSILIKFLRMNFMDLLHYLQKYEDALSWPMLFGKLIQNIFDKKWVEGFENLVNILGIQIFYETTWKWIMYFELKVLWALYVLPMYCDMWLPGDYLARYYSLCDIGILAPIFVMVIEFRLCDGNEFHLCDGILVTSLWWRWVPSLWWHI